MDRVKLALAGLTGSGTALGSIIVAQHVQIWIGIATMVAGLASALLSMYWMNRINKVRMERELSSLCDWCKAGHPPSHCPVVAAERSEDCPLRPGARRITPTPKTEDKEEK